MLKEEILQYVKEHTSTVDLHCLPYNLTAEGMANIFKVKRNTISQYLNEFVSKNYCFKITSRPVHFLHKAVFEENYFLVSRQSYATIYDLKSESKNKDKNSNLSGDMASCEESIFSQVIGYDGSLKKAITEIQASIFYPNNSLPILLTGETGTGKSYIASIVHKYAIEKGVLKKGAPFIIFNCAQYVNNPELLSSNLFGYIKGAFTGADSDFKGVLEAADGGILFLDEVHRLNSEGQEKLFVFLDQGKYRRVGESEGWHHSNVRLIAATTENLSDFFLLTFLRRFPIHIKIPNLKERGSEERAQLIFNFFIQEACFLRKNILISKKVLSVLDEYSFKGNIGMLKNVVKYICASIHAKNQEVEEIKINLLDLPEYLLREVESFNSYHFSSQQSVVITPGMRMQEVSKNTDKKGKAIENLFLSIWREYQRYKSNHRSREQFEGECFREINILFDKLVYEQKSHSEDVIIQYISNSAQGISRYLEYNYSFHLSGNNILAIVVYMYYRNNNLEVNEKMIKLLLEYVQAKCKSELKIASHILALINTNIDLKIMKSDEIIVSLYLKGCSVSTRKSHTRAIILAHGYATASSIANTVNRFLKENIFDAFDMSFDFNINDIIQRVLQYIKENDIERGLVILVDMGTLWDIYTPLKQFLKEPVVIINNVSTQLALQTGSLLLEDSPLEEMVKLLKNSNLIDCKIFYPEDNKQKAVLTCCATGIGTAIKLRDMVRASIPEGLDINVISYDYKSLRVNGVKDSIFKELDVIGIIGTIDPGIHGVEYLALEQLISGEAVKKLYKILHPITDNGQIGAFNDNLVKQFTLERLIEKQTILDSNKIISQIEECLEQYTFLTGSQLSNNKKHAIYFHVACMTERLIRKMPVDIIDANDSVVNSLTKEFNIIKKSFSGIEKHYSVEIPTSELYYIYNILFSSDV